MIFPLSFLRRLLLAGLFLLAGPGSPALARDAEVLVQQNQVKIAYLYHFLQLVKWPNEEGAGSDAALTLCVLGKDSFGENIDALARRKSRGRGIVVRRLGEASRVDQCHLLFVAATQTGAVSEAVHRADAHAILTVGDAREFVAQGGMIGFVVAPADGDGGVKVRFEINLEAARRKGFQVSSKLLELATYVKQ